MQTPPISPFPPEDGSPEWFPQVLKSVHTALRSAVIAGQSEIAARLLYWEDLTSETGGAYYSTFSGHPGLPADVIDGRARYAVTSSLAETFRGRVHVAGEEDLSTLSIMPLELLVVVDPLDGTGPAKHLGGGHSSVALGYLRSQSGFTLLAGAVAGPSNIVVTWRRDHEGPGLVVEAGLVSSAPEDDRRVPLNESAGAIAVGAYKPVRGAAEDGEPQRAGCRPDSYSDILVGDDSRAVYNTAGTPVTWALIGLELGAIICRAQQTPWDSAYLLPLVYLDGCVLTPDGEANRDKVLGWFEGFSLDEKNQKSIPPHIAAVTSDLAHELASQYGFDPISP